MKGCSDEERTRFKHLLKFEFFYLPTSDQSNRRTIARDAADPPDCSARQIENAAIVNRPTTADEAVALNLIDLTGQAQRAVLIDADLALSVVKPNGDYDDATGLNGSNYLGNIHFGGRFIRNALIIEPKVVFPGDVNLDKVVDLDDFNIILENFNTAVSSITQGDLNGDGDVDFADFDIWKVNFPGAAITAGLAAQLDSVPEPSTAVLVILFTAVCALRRPRAHLSPV